MLCVVLCCAVQAEIVHTTATTTTMEVEAANARKTENKVAKKK